MIPSGLERFSLLGQKAIVTGGSRGLGRAIAEGLVSAGAHVAIVARDEEEATRAAREIGRGTIALVGDVGELDMSKLVSSAEERLEGPLHTVVHSAGLQFRAPAERFPAEEWARIMRVNLTAPFLLSQEVGSRQLDRGLTGSHIFIGSLASVLSLPNVAAYTASKSGIFGLMRNLSTEWASRGIRSNAIGPGYIKTRLTQEVFQDEKRSAELLARTPMDRFGTPEDMVGAAIFLASHASSFITGQMVMVDGGWSTS